MFKSIKIKNLRAITDLEINNLGQVNLFVGRNSSGKTTLLEAIFFLIGATNPKLPVNANTFRGLPFVSNKLWDSYFHNMDPTIPIEIGGQILATIEEQLLLIRPHHPKQTEAEPVPVPSDVASPSFAPGDSETTRKLDGLELTYTSSEDPSNKITSTVFLRNGDLITEGTMERAIRGIFINSVTMYDWKDRFAEVQRKKRLGEVISLLKEIEPNISDLRLNEFGLLEADSDLLKLIPPNLMGGGIAKFLSIALAMIVYQNGIVLIDELENGLQHSAQQKIWEAVLNWAQDLNVQVFATTHSIECVKAFNNSADTTLFGSQAKLYRIERKDEKFRAVEYTKELLAESLESNWEIR
ncbi:MAG: AAA family ATPase [Sedimentisphaerales bacterium]|jgi:AAA15 family ATPase/GTPase